MRDEPPTGPKSAPDNTGAENSVGSFAGAGIQFAVSIVAFLLLGQWADKKFGTSPLFVLLGVFVGGGAAFYSMYRRLIAVQNADDERRKREREAREK